MDRDDRRPDRALSRPIVGVALAGTARRGGEPGVTWPSVYCDPMSEVPHRTSGDEVELGTLLALLHGTDDRFQTVQATYRTWRHEQRLPEAFRPTRRAEASRRFVRRRLRRQWWRAGARETEETVRIWRDGQRFREELHGGRQDGYYGVADGPLWWFWDEHIGASSNQDNPSAQSGVGQRLQVLLNPIPLLSSLRFRVTGNSQVAGRAAVTAHATPRPHDPRHGGFTTSSTNSASAPSTTSSRSTRNAECYWRLLPSATSSPSTRSPRSRSASMSQSKPRHSSSAAGRRTDPAHPGSRLCSESRHRGPAARPIHRSHPRPVPAGWQVRCVFIEGNARPPSPAQVSLSYRSEDGHQSTSIWQMAAADRASHFGNMINHENWQEVVRDGTSVRVSPAEWPQAQAHLERNGTSITLTSNNLTSDQLVTIAVGLKPAPSGGSI